VPRIKKSARNGEVTALGRGLSARTIAIGGLEQAADWLDFRDRMIRSLVPEGDLEIEFALIVAECLWRRRRIARHEQHIVEIERHRDGAREAWRQHAQTAADSSPPQASSAGPPPAGSPPPSGSINGAAPGDLALSGQPGGAHLFYGGMLANLEIQRAITPERMLPDKGELGRIIRYEQHIARQLWHALHELQALQAARRGEPAPFARVSFLGA